MNKCDVTHTGTALEFCACATPQANPGDMPTPSCSTGNTTVWTRNDNLYTNTLVPCYSNTKDCNMGCTPFKTTSPYNSCE